MDTLGKMKFIDTGHPCIRELTRPASACFASFPVSEDTLEKVAAGDFIMLPEMAEREPRWLSELPKDGLAYVIEHGETQISFGQYADGELPDPPNPMSLVLVRNGRQLAAGRMDMLGEMPAFAVEEVF